MKSVLNELRNSHGNALVITWCPTAQNRCGLFSCTETATFTHTIMRRNKPTGNVHHYCSHHCQVFGEIALETGMLVVGLQIGHRACTKQAA